MQMIDACSLDFDDSRRNSEGRFGRSGADSDGEPNMRPRNSIKARPGTAVECQAMAAAICAAASCAKLLLAAISELRCTPTTRDADAAEDETPAPKRDAEDARQHRGGALAHPRN